MKRQRRIGEPASRRSGAKALRHCRRRFAGSPAPRLPGSSFNLFAWRLREAFLLLALSFLCGPLQAVSDNAGTKNGAFLKIPTDGRGVVLGAGMTALAEGTDALRWNPAGLAATESKEIAATHIEYYQDVNIENVAVNYPFGAGSLAVSGFYLGSGDLDGRDLIGNPTGDFTYYNLVGTVGYGHELRSRTYGTQILFGAAVKIVQEKIDESQYQNPAVDAGLIISPWETLRLGVALRNFASSEADFPKEINGAAAYTFQKRITGSLGLRYTDDAAPRVHAGLEFNVPELEGVLRAGYQTHDELGDSEDSSIPAFRSGGLGGLTLGGGFVYQPPIWQKVKLALDYGMAPFGALGISHTVTVKVRW